MTYKIAAIVLGLWLGASSSGAVFAADAASAGKAVFEKSCAGCHGKDGKGNPAMAKALGEKGLNLTAKDAAQKSDEDLLKVISQGAGKMPAQKISKEEQKEALAYIRSLQK